MNTRHAGSSNKRRRLPRACDNCKHKKGILLLFELPVLTVSQSNVSSEALAANSALILTGNSDEMPGKRCSNCIAYNVQCKHVEALNVRNHL